MEKKPIETRSGWGEGGNETDRKVEEENGVRGSRDQKKREKFMGRGVKRPLETGGMRKRG